MKLTAAQREVMALIGAKGGSATGASKRRDPALYKRLAAEKRRESEAKGGPRALRRAAKLKRDAAARKRARGL